MSTLVCICQCPPGSVHRKNTCSPQASKLHDCQDMTRMGTMNIAMNGRAGMSACIPWPPVQQAPRQLHAQSLHQTSRLSSSLCRAVQLSRQGGGYKCVWKLVSGISIPYLLCPPVTTAVLPCKPKRSMTLLLGASLFDGAAITYL